jgi:hypothetical protein
MGLTRGNKCIIYVEPRLLCTMGNVRHAVKLFNLRFVFRLVLPVVWNTYIPFFRPMFSLSTLFPSVPSFSFLSWFQKKFDYFMWLVSLYKVCNIRRPYWVTAMFNYALLWRMIRSGLYWAARPLKLRECKISVLLYVSAILYKHNSDIYYYYYWNRSAW